MILPSPCPCWGPCPGKLIGCSPLTPKLSKLHEIIVHVASWTDTGGSSDAVAEQGASLEIPVGNNRVEVETF
jgi:hypothetical protein